MEEILLAKRLILLLSNCKLEKKNKNPTIELLLKNEKVAMLFSVATNYMEMMINVLYERYHLSRRG